MSKESQVIDDIHTAVLDLVAADRAPRCVRSDYAARLLAACNNANDLPRQSAEVYKAVRYGTAIRLAVFNLNPN